MTTTSPAPRVDEPAPLALVNTIWIDRNDVHDVLADVADVRTWVRAIGERCGLVPAMGRAEDVSTDAAAHLIDLRDALRRLAAERTQDPRSLGQVARARWGDGDVDRQRGVGDEHGMARASARRSDVVVPRRHYRRLIRRCPDHGDCSAGHLPGRQPAVGTVTAVHRARMRLLLHEDPSPAVVLRGLRQPRQGGAACATSPRLIACAREGFGDRRAGRAVPGLLLATVPDE